MKINEKKNESEKKKEEEEKFRIFLWMSFLLPYDYCEEDKMLELFFFKKGNKNLKRNRGPKVTHNTNMSIMYRTRGSFNQVLLAF